MTPKQRRRVKRRIKSIDARLELIERRLEGLKIAKRKAVRGILDRLVRRAIENNAELRELYDKADKDKDGTIEPDEMEELIELLADWLDDHYEPENEWLEKLSDLGLEILAWVALAVHRDTAARLRRRRTRLKQRKGKLGRQLEKAAKKETSKKKPS